MHISDKIEALLEAQGRTPEGYGAFSKLIEDFEQAGSLSDGTRRVRLEISPQGRWMQRVDGWGVTIKDLDLRDYWEDPEGAIKEVLKCGK